MKCCHFYKIEYNKFINNYSVITLAYKYIAMLEYHKEFNTVNLDF